MICPKCGSNNVSVQMVTDTQLKKKGHGVLYWLFFGWLIDLLLWMFLTVPMLIVKIFAPKRYALKSKHSSMCVCQNCGHHWKPKRHAGPVFPETAAPAPMPAAASPARLPGGVIHTNHIAPERLDLVRDANSFHALGIICENDAITEIAALKYSYGQISGSYSAKNRDISGAALVSTFGTQALLVGYDIRAQFPRIAPLLKSVEADAEWDYVDLKECADFFRRSYDVKPSAYDEAKAASEFFRALCRESAALPSTE